MFTLVTTLPNGATETAEFRSDTLATAAYETALAEGERPVFLGEAPLTVDVKPEHEEALIEYRFPG